MSAIEKAMQRSRLVTNQAMAIADHTKASGFVDLAPMTGVDQFNSYRQQSVNRNRYAQFRGWVYSAINAIAAEGAGQEVKVGRIVDKNDPNAKPVGKKSRKDLLDKMPKHLREKAADQEFEILENHPILKVLERPNSIQMRWQFAYSFIANLCLTGWSYVIGGNADDGMELYSLPTTWVTPKHEKGAFSQFKIQNPRKPSAGDDKDLIDRDHVSFAYLPNPVDPMAAMAPSQAQDRAINIDDNIQTSQNEFFYKGIFPSAIVTVGRNPHPDVKEGIRPRLTAAQRRQVHAVIRKTMSGVGNYGDAAIIDGMIEKIERLSATQTEMGWEKSEKVVRARILSAFSVHPFILGEEVAGSYAQSYNVQERFYRRVNTYLSMMSTVVTDIVQKALNDTSIFVWWEEMKPFDPSMDQSMWNAARQRDDVSQNEFRAKMGLPPDEDKNESLIGKQLAQQVITVAEKVASGAISPDQGRTILEGLGLPSDQAKKIAGKAPEKPPTPPPGQDPVNGSNADQSEAQGNVGDNQKPPNGKPKKKPPNNNQQENDEIEALKKAVEYLTGGADDVMQKVEGIVG